MKVKCPKCKSQILRDNLNVATDVAYCEKCDESFKISEMYKEAPSDSFDIQATPKGVSFVSLEDKAIITASTRSAAAFFLIPFMLVWSGGSLGGIYGPQIVKGELNLMLALFGIPFILGSFIFWALAFMSIGGHVKITVGYNLCKIYTGFGGIGWTKKVTWDDIDEIKEEIHGYYESNATRHSIVLEGKTRVKFGTMLNEARRYYVLNALKHLKAAKSEF